MQMAAHENPHLAGINEGVRHVLEPPPSVILQAVDTNFRLDRLRHELDEPEQHVIVSPLVVPEPVDADGENRGAPHVDGGVRQELVLPRGGVPNDDVVGGVGDAEQAVAGAEDADLVAVAHERVVHLGDAAVAEEGGEVDAVEAGGVAEEEGEVGGGLERAGEVGADELAAVDDVAPPLGDGAAPEQRLDREAVQDLGHQLAGQIAREFRHECSRP